jgi:peptidoglycan L-alanyl-D-glutamate endopeptidase CwlK
MTRKFSQRSLDSLKNVHPDLIRVIANALQSSPVDFTVIEGRRTVERQKQLVASGASRTMNSRHLHGLAVDLYPGSWDWSVYNKLGPAVKAAAAQEGVSITWGGDWTTFKDGPHFELPHALYPDGMKFDAVDPATVTPRYAVPQPVSAPVVAEPVNAMGRTVDQRLDALEAAVRRLQYQG